MKTMAEIKVTELTEDRAVVGGVLAVTKTGIFRLAEEGLPGRVLRRGDVEAAKQMVRDGKV